jgi:hypothetical protein
MEPTRLFPLIVLLSLAYFVRLGRAGYSAGVTIDARRLQPTVNI